MRTLSFLVAFCGLIFSCYAQNWKKIADFPGVERDDGASFVIGSRAYAGSGVVPFTPLRDFYSFDFKSQNWTSIAPLPNFQGRQYSAAFASSQYGFILGGISTQFLNDLWRYNPISNQWQKMADLPAEGRGGSAAFVIDSFAYIIGGKTQNQQAISEVWAYNMNTDIWTKKADLPQKRWRSAATTYQSKGYLIFGLDDSLNYSTEVYEYEPLNDQWTVFSAFPDGGRNYVKAHTINNSLITIAGQDSASVFLNDCWKLDFTSKNWKEITPLPSAGRRGGMSFNDGFSIYYTTGLGDSGRRYVESWKFENPTALNEFSSASNLDIYPNPANDVLYIDFALGSINFELINIKGERVKVGSLTSNSKIDLSDYQPGLYFLKLSNKEQQSTKRIIVY